MFVSAVPRLASKVTYWPPYMIGVGSLADVIINYHRVVLMSCLAQSMRGTHGRVEGCGTLVAVVRASAEIGPSGHQAVACDKRSTKNEYTQ